MRDADLEVHPVGCYLVIPYVAQGPGRVVDRRHVKGADLPTLDIPAREAMNPLSLCRVEEVRPGQRVAAARAAEEGPVYVQTGVIQATLVPLPHVTLIAGNDNVPHEVNFHVIVASVAVNSVESLRPFFEKSVDTVVVDSGGREPSHEPNVVILNVPHTGAEGGQVLLVAEVHLVPEKALSRDRDRRRLAKRAGDVEKAVAELLHLRRVNVLIQHSFQGF